MQYWGTSMGQRTTTTPQKRGKRATPRMQFGKLTLVRKVKNPVGVFGVTWVAYCSCNPEKQFKIKEQYLFRKKNPKVSCGCDRKSLITLQKREYGIWKMMNRRCYFKTHASYSDYGGRGIKVYDEWRDQASHGNLFGSDLEAFTRFFNYVGPAPTPYHTLDRKDPDGNYEPGNVRWATPDVQAMNKRYVMRAMAKMAAWKKLAAEKRRTQ